MEKKCRFWSGEWLLRCDSTVATAAAICDGALAARILPASSDDFECESMEYECGVIGDMVERERDAGFEGKWRGSREREETGMGFRTRAPKRG